MVSSLPRGVNARYDTVLPYAAVPFARHRSAGVVDAWHAVFGKLVPFLFPRTTNVHHSVELGRHFSFGGWQRRVVQAPSRGPDRVEILVVDNGQDTPTLTAHVSLAVGGGPDQIRFGRRGPFELFHRHGNPRLVGGARKLPTQPTITMLELGRGFVVNRVPIRSTRTPTGHHPGGHGLAFCRCFVIRPSNRPHRSRLKLPGISTCSPFVKEVLRNRRLLHRPQSNKPFCCIILLLLFRLFAVLFVRFAYHPCCHFGATLRTEVSLHIPSLLTMVSIGFGFTFPHNRFGRNICGKRCDMVLATPLAMAVYWICLAIHILCSEREFSTCTS